MKTAIIIICTFLVTYTYLQTRSEEKLTPNMKKVKIAQIKKKLSDNHDAEAETNRLLCIELQEQVDSLISQYASWSNIPEIEKLGTKREILNAGCFIKGDDETIFTKKFKLPTG